MLGSVMCRNRCRGGAVQFGGLVLLLRHVEQRDHEDDHEVADAPHGEGGEGRFGPGRVVEPGGGGQADRLQERVDRSGAGVEQEDEGERGGHRRGQVRQVEEGPEDPGARLDLGDQQAGAQAEDDPAGDHDDAEPEGVAQGRPELREVGEDVRPVVEAPPLGRVEAVVPHEGEVDGGDERIGEEDAESDQPGRQERQGAQGVASALRPQRVPSPGRGRPGRPPPSRAGCPCSWAVSGRHFAAAMSRSIRAAVSASPFFRSVTSPFSYRWENFWRVSW